MVHFCKAILVIDMICLVDIAYQYFLHTRCGHLGHSKHGPRCPCRPPYPVLHVIKDPLMDRSCSLTLPTHAYAR
uniref:Putative secreted protein n=1 Tax=Rhipicephalus microplus TaxID=6941 RepID=A0A6M2DE81_RHIMP